MTSNDMKYWVLINEPVFTYHGRTYSVCCVNEKYYVDGPDGDAEFSSFDELLANWKLDGNSFAEACKDFINQ